MNKMDLEEVKYESKQVENLEEIDVSYDSTFKVK